MRKAALIALALAAGAAAAQEPQRPHPGDPAAKVPPAAYRSAFEGYRPFADQQVQDWRKANEEVGAAGGHKGQLAPQAPARDDKRQGAPGHGRHHK